MWTASEFSQALGETAAGGPLIQTFKLLVITGFLRLFQKLSLRLVHGLGGITGSLLSLVPNRARDITRRNLQLCFPELDTAQHHALVRSSLQETARTGFELGRMWLDPLPRVLDTIVSVRGEELVRQAIDAGKGVIVLAPHLGNWELYGLKTSSYGPTTYLYKPPRLQGFETLMTACRKRAGARLVPTNRRGVLLLLKALERGEIVGILPDQEPDLPGGAFAPFFGIQALTMTLASKLAAKTGAAVVCGYARRLPDSQGYEIVYQAADPDVGHVDESVGAAALNRSVEACVCEVPEQYQWEYKRFGKRPPGEPRLYT